MILALMLLLFAPWSPVHGAIVGVEPVRTVRVAPASVQTAKPEVAEGEDEEQQEEKEKDDEEVKEAAPPGDPAPPEPAKPDGLSAVPEGESELDDALGGEGSGDDDVLMGVSSDPVFDVDGFGDLTDLSLEDLLDMEVITVSRKSETVSRAPAAVYVITQEDIHRSGFSSIPEVLRMAPGVHVARINANAWAIAIRGFNGRFNNKLLVMIDGRTVFSTLFSGVYWDVQDVRLEDIERIEVIRGPGGTMWGENAVNGVINIITKSAALTQGGEISTRIGTEEVIGSARYGGRMGDTGYWRAYLKAAGRDASQALDGSGDNFDQWSHYRAGFRMDWHYGGQDLFTLQGDVYDGESEELSTVTKKTPPPDDVFRGDVYAYGGNMLGRWKRIFSATSELQLQMFLDMTRRDSDLFRDSRDMVDFDFQHRFRVGTRNDVLWGLGYRVTMSDFQGSPGFGLDSSTRYDEIYSAFLQDDVTLVPERLNLILGSKIQHNDFTGVQLAPNARMVWTPSETHSIWASVSKAVRTPSVVQSDLVQDVAQTSDPATSTTVTTRLYGNDDLGADELTAYEIGWRFGVMERMFVDLTGFYNDFNAAENFQVGQGIDLGGGNFLVPIRFDNSREAQVYGFEAALDLNVTERWRLRSAFSYLDLQFAGDVLGTPIQPQSPDEEPNYLANLRSYWTPLDGLDFDLGLYAVDALTDLDVPGYLRLDARLAYRPADNLEFVLGVQGATDDKQQEFVSASLSTASYIERALYFYLRWRW